NVLTGVHATNYHVAVKILHNAMRNHISINGYTTAKLLINDTFGYQNTFTITGGMQAKGTYPTVISAPNSVVFDMRSNGTALMGGILNDFTTKIASTGDNTKQAKFNATLISTGHTENYNLPNKNGTIALLSDV